MMILNEKEYAEYCIKENYIDKKPFKTLSILAKYYYHYCNYKPKKIKELLNEFIQKNYALYEINKYSWSNTIDKIANNVHKYKLYEINGVWITKGELEKIKELNNKALEKLAFTLLCLAKLNILKNENNIGWVNNDANEIFTLANSKCSMIDMYKRLNKLVALGYIDTAKSIDNLSLKVNYIDNSSIDTLFVDDFRNLGYKYFMYLGENYTRCVECGIVIKNNKNRTKKYCKNCAGYKPKKKEYKTIKCIDCGKEFIVSAQNKRTVRCEECNKTKRKNDKKMYMRKLRNSKKVGDNE